MPAVKVKVLGRFLVTRRTYLTLQLIELLLILALIGVGLWWPRPPQPAEDKPQAAYRLVVGLLDILHWVGLVLLLVWWPVETFIYLRRFARKQAEADQTAPP